MQTLDVCLTALKQDGNVLKFVANKTPEKCIAAMASKIPNYYEPLDTLLKPNNRDWLEANIDKYKNLIIKVILQLTLYYGAMGDNGANYGRTKINQCCSAIKSVGVAWPELDAILQSINAS
jgi:hypothetical protein